MYNRYIPQPDGSYRKNQIPDKKVVPPPPPCRTPLQPEKQPSNVQPEKTPVPGSLRPNAPMPPPCPPKKTPVKSPPHASVDSFLRQLLPAEFDTSDLFIILLLLLMAGDTPNDRSNALLTLALYFFL